MISLMMAAVTSGALLLHPVHQTVSEMEWNPKTRCVEVALRLDLLDEQWIRKRVETAPADPKRDGWQAAYLQSRLWFDPVRDSDGDGQWSGKPIRWVGRKQDGGYAWWFFEVFCEDGKPPTAVRTRLLFDREPGYDHRIILLNCVKSDDRDRCAVELNEQKPQAELSLQPAKGTSQP